MDKKLLRSVREYKKQSFLTPVLVAAEVFENVSFQIDTEWKLGLVGRNGRGKTTLLKLLLGEYEYRGKITGAVTFDYFPFIIFRLF